MENDSVGQVALDVVANEQPLQRQIAGLGDKLQAPMSKLGSKIAAAFSAAAIIKFGKDSIEAAAQVNAANSQMAQTFGNLEDKARGVISGIAKDSGILETRLQGVGTSIYAFAKTSGMDSASAMTLMQDALQATADSAAYYDRSLEDTAESLKSFLKGNYANDAALGISCTETTRNAAANKLYGKSFKDLSEAQKQLTLLQMVKDANALSGAMGQAAREADGWENVTGNLKESWRQLLAVVGQPVLKIATTFVKRLTSGLQQLTVYAKAAVQSIGNLLHLDFSGVADSGSDAANNIGSVADSADDGTESIKKTTKAAEKLKKAVAGFDQLNILSSDKSSDGSSEDSSADSSASSGSLTMPDTSKAETAIDKLNIKLDGLRNKLKDIFEKSGIGKAIDNFKKHFDKINFLQIGKNLQSIFTALLPVAKTALEGTKKIAQSTLGFIGTLAGGIVRTVANNFQTATGGIAQWLKKDKEKIAEFIKTITDNISTGIDNCTEIISDLFDELNKSIGRMRKQTEKAIATLLSGFTDLGGSIVTILTGAFAILTGSIKNWVKKNKQNIGEFFDNTQGVFNKVATLVGTIFSDIGKKLSEWWKNSGVQTTFANICNIFGDVATAALELYNNAIKPAVDSVIEKLTEMYNSASPIIGSVLDLLKSLGDYIVALWNDQIKPVIDVVVATVGPVIQGVVDTVVGVLQGMWDMMCGIVNGVVKIFSGVLDFFTGIFTNDWGKSWNGIQKIFQGVIDAIVGAVKGFVTLVVNFFKGLFETVAGIFRMVGALIVNAVKRITEKIGNVVGKLKDLFKGLWDKISELFGNIGEWFSDQFSKAWDGVKNIWNGAAGFFTEVWKGIKNAFSTAKDWLVKQFSSAWDSVKGLFSKGGKIFNGIKDGLGDVFKKAVNDLISGINWVIKQPIKGLNSVLSKIKGVNIAGIKPFDFISEIPVPSIPKLAKGGLVTAPTLAMVGDNKRASVDPEVVAPLSKLQSMINSGNPEIIRLLSKIAALLENEETVYNNIIQLDSEVIDRKLVKVRKRKQRRYGGAVT